MHHIADADQNRFVSRTELIGFIGQGFTKIDRDGNGKIDEAELRGWLNQSLPPPPGDGRPERPPGAAELAPRLLKEWDMDRNGVVTAEEARQAAGSAFDQCDTNHDGGLGMEEWMRWLDSLIGPPPRAIEGPPPSRLRPE